jgi:hypothetical protein
MNEVVIWLSLSVLIEDKAVQMPSITTDHDGLVVKTSGS